MSLNPAPSRLATVVLTTIATMAAAVLAAAPAQAGNRVTPGSFTGYGFDQCVTPTQEAMDAWLTSSPYWAVGIYIAGDSRYCGDDKQVNLTPEWVSTQLGNGWRLLPITVGPQAWCNTRYKGKVRISPDPTDNYAKARTQGREEARSTVQAARRLGIVERSTLWYDLENFDETRIPCRESALSFLSAWTNKLHDLGYVSGVYSSAGSGIKALDQARLERPGAFTMPDRVWIAEWIHTTDYARAHLAASVDSAYIADDGWMPHDRVRQYLGGHTETYGGVTINIDSNYLDLGRGSVAPPEPEHCGGVTLNFPRYRRLAWKDDGAQVKAAQCLLRRLRFYQDDLRFFYTLKTRSAVRGYQASRSLPVSGVMTPRTWTALLSEGPKPLVKIGSARPAVRRAQRALNAAVEAGLPVTGVFDRATTRAVRSYQQERGMRRTGVIASDTWAELARGRR